jgi:endonuclease IV
MVNILPPRIGYTIWRKDIERAEDLINELISYSLDHVEIDIDSLFDLEDLTWISKFRSLLEKYNISIGIHGPWKELYIASPQVEIREAAIKVIEKVIDKLNNLNYEYIVLHPSSDNPICQDNVIYCINALADSISRLIEKDQRIVIETIQGRCCGQINQLELLLDKRPDIKICVDLAHIYAENTSRFKELNKLSNVIDIISEKILRNTSVLHLHGVYIEGGKTRSHRDFSQIALGEDRIFLLTQKHRNIRYIVFEVFYSRNGKSSWPHDVEREVKRLRDLYGSLNSS